MCAPAGRRIASVLLCIAGLACDRRSAGPAPAKTTGPATQSSAAVSASYDLLEHPELVKDSSIAFTSFTMHGVRIGDSIESIPPDIIEARGTWRIKNKDLTLYGIQDGKVVSLVVQDPEKLTQLNLTSPGAIETQIGPPEEVSQNIFRYPSRHLSITWDRRKSCVMELTVTNRQLK